MAHSFLGTNPFFQGPLYPYWLAAVRVLGAQTQELVLVIQVILGAFSVGLLADAMRRLASNRSSLIVGVLVAGNAMWTFFDCRILAESILLGLECAYCWMLSFQLQRKDSRMIGLGIGTLVGLMAQVRASHVVMFLPLVVLTYWLERANPRRAVRQVGFAGFMVILLTMPSALWNWSKTHAFIPYSYNGGLNLYIGNGPGANGLYVGVDGTVPLGSVEASSPDGSASQDGRDYLAHVEGLSLTAEESSRFWTRRAIQSAVSDPLRTLGLAGRKVLLMLNRLEAQQIEYVETYQKLAGPVGWPLIGEFWPVLALAGLALAVQVNRRPAAWMALSLVSAQILVITPFFVTDRYRIHLLPGLALLAALGLTAVEEARQSSARAHLWRGVIAAVALTLIAWVPVEGQSDQYKNWRALTDEGVRWLEVGNPSAAIAVFTQARRMEVEMFRTPSRAQENRDRAELHYNLGVALRQLGDRDAAFAEFGVAARLDTSNAKYRRTLGDAYLVSGRRAEADSLLGGLRALLGGDAEADLSEGFRAARDGDFPSALRSLEAAVEKDARSFVAWGALIRVHVLQDSFVVAKRTLDRAARAGLPRLHVTAYGAWIAAAQGDLAQARVGLQELSGVQLDPMLSRVVADTRDRVEGTSNPHEH